MTTTHKFPSLVYGQERHLLVEFLGLLLAATAASGHLAGRGLAARHDGGLFVRQVKVHRGVGLPQRYGNPWVGVQIRS